MPRILIFESIYSNFGASNELTVVAGYEFRYELFVAHNNHYRLCVVALFWLVAFVAAIVTMFGPMI